MISQQQHREVIALIIQAGQIALKMREAGQLNPRQKGEETYSTVTDADIEVSRIVTTGLSNLFPNLEVISEEDETHNNFGQYGDAVLVDPIDGTGTFNRGDAKFSVLVAFIQNKKPIHGFAYFPDPRISKIYHTSPVNDNSYEQVVEIHQDHSFLLKEFKQLQNYSSHQDLRVSQVYSDATQVLQDLDFSICLLYTSPSPRDQRGSRMPSSA